MANHKKKKKSINQPENESGGNLFLVSTPIGNLEDMTVRAKRILAEVDFILAEDTRTARFLLSQFAIKRTILSYYSYNEEKRIPQILIELKNGKNIALISEADRKSVV